MRSTEWRPLGVGELVDGALSLARANLITLGTITAVLVVPFAAIEAISRTWGSWSGNQAPWGRGGVPMLGASVGWLLVLVAGLVALGAAVHASGQAFLGSKPNWFDSISDVWRRRDQVGKVLLALGLGVSIGLCMLVLPGLLVASVWGLALPVALFEGAGWKASLERSRVLATRLWWPLFATVAVAFAAMLAVRIAIEIALAPVAWVPGGDFAPITFTRFLLAGALAPIVTTPFVASLLTLAYVDTTHRADELDLDLMAKNLDVEPGAVGEAVIAGLASPSVFRGPIDQLVRKGERDLRWLHQKTQELIEQIGRPSERGEPAMPIEPDRPLAIMFTDVDGSTPLTETLGDLRAREILRGHEDLVHSGIRAWGGRAVRHTGDGVMACFPSASQALECALMIEREQDVRNSVTGEPISVRIGINAGEPVAENGDLFGVAVNVARSILDVAQPGQVLVSEVVRQLAAGKGFMFEECGARPLDGLSEPVRLYALLAR